MVRVKGWGGGSLGVVEVEGGVVRVNSGGWGSMGWGCRVPTSTTDTPKLMVSVKHNVKPFER